MCEPQIEQYIDIDKQPPVLAWSDYRQNGSCGGAKMELPVKDSDYGVNLCWNDKSIKHDDIDTMWIPPNMEVRVGPDCRNFMYNRQTLDGRGSYVSMFNGPGPVVVKGRYAGGFPDQSRIGANDIDWIDVLKPRYPWSEHVKKCCGGDMDQSTCWKFKAGSADDPNLQCRKVFQRCTGESLKTDPLCQEMCRRDPVECSKIKMEFCNANPNDSYCQCINIDKNPVYDKFKEVLLKNGKGAPRVMCTPINSCNIRHDDLSGVFLTNSMIKDIETPCPDISSLLSQEFKVDGDGNIIDTKFNAEIGSPQTVPEPSKTGSNPPSTNASSPAVTSSASSSPIIYIVIIFFMLLVIVGIIYSLSGSKKYESQMNFTQSKMSPSSLIMETRKD
jgi:hypothetical protein